MTLSLEKSGESFRSAPCYCLQSEIWIPTIKGMSITIGDIIVWLIIGAFAGAVAGAIVKRKKEGYGRWKNFGIGLAGAIIGGVIYKLIGYDFGLSEITISAADLVWALLGSFLLLAILWFVQYKRGRNEVT